MNKLVPFYLCGLLATVPADAANIMFVSFHSGDNTPSAAAATAGFTQAPDVGYTQLLQNNGHTVTRVVTSDLPNAALLNTADLVIISRSVPSGHYELDAETAAWNGITAPTIILGGYILRNNRLGYTTGSTIPDTASSVKLRVNVPNHPIFAGVALDASGLMVNDYASIATHTNTPQRGISVNSNPLSGGGVTLATIGTPGDPANGGMVIGEWLAGDAMATSPVDALGGHRLVLLTGSRENAAITGGAAALTSEAAGIYDLTPDGATLLLNAVNYMTSGRAALRSVDTVNNESPGPNETSLAEALTGLQDGDYIRFKIPGAGPHVITTPLGGYPLITAHGVTIDGYSQAGSVPNTNPILGGNNAQIKIVLDSTGADTGASDPQDPSLNSRRSTRILHSGYGDSENGILAVFGGDNFDVRGLVFIGRPSAGSTEDPAIYAVALVNEATNAHIHGCLFGIMPGQSTQSELKPVAAAVAAFRYRTGGDVYSYGAKIGTDGDGVNDRAEFNVVLGARDAFPLELPGARISGNYVNIFQNGLSFVDIDEIYSRWRAAFEAGGSDPDDVHIENYENGRVTEGTVIGTNGDGISDSDERNVFGHVVYDHLGEFYSSSANAVLAGNYFGVGVDGVTPAPVSTNVNPDFVEFGGNVGQVRIGSNGDGVSDDLEGNLIVNVAGGRFYVGSSATPVVSRGNKLVNCGVAGVPFAEGDNGIVFSAYYAPYLADASQGVVPVIKSLSGGILKISIPAPSAAYPNTALDLYLADTVALAKNNFYPAAMIHPGAFLGTYTDNGPLDTDPAANELSIDVSAFGITDSTVITAAASYSSEAGNFNAINAVTTPMSSPFSAKPVLSIKVDAVAFTTELSWLGAPNLFDLQINNNVEDSGNWSPLPAGSVAHTGGRNIVTTSFENFDGATFYRLISK
jgi:hypothetical protein